MLTVTAQQSRFHNEAIEGSSLKELVVKDLNVSIGNREILNHASFQLQVGRHYILSGRNGKEIINAHIGGALEWITAQANRSSIRFQAQASQVWKMNS